jgi:hypothetical protein
MFESIYKIIKPSVPFSELLQARRQRWWVQGQLPQISRLSGKLEGRAFMEGNGFKVPREIGLYSYIDDIPDFSELPSRFVLKPSSGYSAKNVFVMSDGMNLLDGKNYDRDSILAAVRNLWTGRAVQEGCFWLDERRFASIYPASVWSSCSGPSWESARTGPA